MSPSPAAVAFAAGLRGAEDRLRACGLTGRDAFAALCRHLAARLGLPPPLWPPGPDAPAAAALDQLALPLPPAADGLDLFGLSYERFFSDLFKAERGQYFTPHPLVALMVDLAALSPGVQVLDPTCGAGGFLIEAHRRGARVQGIELDPELAALARLNLALAGVAPDTLGAAVRHGDAFALPTADDPAVDVILANPPFSVAIADPAVLARYTLAAGRERVLSDELFLELAWSRLRPGGRLVAVLPRSILANHRTAGLRAWLEARFVRRAVISLPEGIFRPFGGAAAQAVVVALDRRPVAATAAGPSPGWIPWVVEDPGYDVTRKVYRPTDRNDLAALRVLLAAGTAPRTAAAVWLPERALAAAGIAPTVPRVPLGALAQIESPRLRPAETPDAAFVEVDLADVDKSTGEVQVARVRLGDAFKGEKVDFAEGDVLFSRLRPQLCGVAVVSRPDPDMPERMCGSTEWVRLRAAPERAHFVLLAARSSFVRERLTATSGQTRPRARLEDLPALEVPDPGAEAQALLAQVVATAHRERLAARRRLDQAAQLYEAFGRGELDTDALLAAVRVLAGAEPGT